MIPEREALERSQPGDVLHVLEVDARLALDVEADPVAEGQPVAEAGVDRVLEMGVRVDEARDDGRVGEAPALAELGGGPDGDDPAVLDRHGSVGDGRPGDGQHPVRGEITGETMFPPWPPSSRERFGRGPAGLGSRARLRPLRGRVSHGPISRALDELDQPGHSDFELERRLAIGLLGAGADGLLVLFLDGARRQLGRLLLVLELVGSSLPLTEFLNSRIPLPTERPISGSRREPKTRSSTTTRMMISVGLTFGMWLA